MTTILPEIASIPTLELQRQKSRERALHLGEKQAFDEHTLEDELTCAICFTQAKPEDFASFCACAEQGNHTCKSCAAFHFSSTINNSYDGACPRMKCPLCLKGVHSEAWKQFVSKQEVVVFERRASNLLSIRCNGCESRVSQMPLATYNGRVTDADNEMLVAQEALLRTPNPELLQKLIASYESSKINHIEAFSAIIDMFGGMDHLKSLADAEGTPRFNTDLTVFRLDNLHHAIIFILRCIHDSERRATLHCRYLYHFPKIRSVCCNVTLCFKCRVTNWHSGRSCEELQMNQFGQNDVLVVTCPSCGISLVKGDGCSSVRCVCDHVMSWDTELARARLVQAKVQLLMDFPWARQEVNRLTSISSISSLRNKLTQEANNFQDITEIIQFEAWYEAQMIRFESQERKLQDTRLRLLEICQERCPDVCRAELLSQVNEKTLAELERDLSVFYFEDFALLDL